jgi:hypothetical protein
MDCNDSEDLDRSSRKIVLMARQGDKGSPLVTLRSLDDNANVYASARQALQRGGSITQTLATGVNINI